MKIFFTCALLRHKHHLVVHLARYKYAHIIGEDRVLVVSPSLETLANLLSSIFA